MAASLGVEWAKEGVRVNAIRYFHCHLETVTYILLILLCISPGYMLTDLTKKILTGKEALKVSPYLLNCFFLLMFAFRKNGRQ